MIEEAGELGRALRVDDWKYSAEVKGWKKKPGNPAELYNLDSSEQKKLVDTNQEMAEAMAKQLQELIDAGGVRM